MLVDSRLGAADQARDERHLGQAAHRRAAEPTRGTLPQQVGGLAACGFPRQAQGRDNGRLAQGKLVEGDDDRPLRRLELGSAQDFHRVGRGCLDGHACGGRVRMGVCAPRSSLLIPALAACLIRWLCCT